MGWSNRMKALIAGLIALVVGVAGYYWVGRTASSSPLAALRHNSPNQPISFYPGRVVVGHGEFIYFLKLDGGLWADVFQHQGRRWSVVQTGQMPRVAGCIKPQAVGATVLTVSQETYVVGQLEKSSPVSGLTYHVAGESFSAQFLKEGLWAVRLGKTFAGAPETLTLRGASNQPVSACEQL